MLVISLIATAQFSHSHYKNLRETLISNVDYNLIDSMLSEDLEERDEPFNFDTKTYLPLGFNPYAKTTDLDIVEIDIEEEDEPFNFNTKAYLPEGFDPNPKNTILDVAKEVIVEEEDEAFDFNTKDYLPLGFNVKNKIIDVLEIEIEEKDEPFAFDTKAYLPKDFDPYTRLALHKFETKLAKI